MLGFGPRLYARCLEFGLGTGVLFVAVAAFSLLCSAAEAPANR